MHLFDLSESSQWITAFHGGGKIDQFNMEHLGRGEGAHVLGPGIYFATDATVARRYMTYASDPHLYQVELNMSRVYDPVKGIPATMRGIGDRMAQSIGYTDIDAVPFGNEILKYGRWPVGPLVQLLGVKKAHQLFQEFRLDGLYETLPSGILEIAMFNLNAIRNIEEVNSEK